MKPPVIEWGPEEGRAMMVKAFGPKAAAWLVGVHRKLIGRRQRRALQPLNFDILEGADLPAWFSIAFCYLRDHRSKKWWTSKATHVRSNGSRVVRYAIGWRGRISTTTAAAPQ